MPAAIFPNLIFRMPLVVCSHKRFLVSCSKSALTETRSVRSDRTRVTLKWSAHSEGT